MFAAWKEGRALRESSGQWDRRMMLFLLWVLVPLVFFSLSQSKRPQYVLPLIPAIGLLAAQVLTGSRMRVPTTRVAGLVLVAIGVVILFAKLIVRELLDLDGAVMQAIPSTAVPLGAICLAAGAATYASAHRTGVAVLALCVPTASIPFVSFRLMDAIGSDRSARELSRSIESVLTDETDVVTVGAYPLSLPFYLRRTLILSSTDGSELTSNFLTRTYSRWTGIRGSPLRPADWWFDALTECPRPTVFVVRSDNTRVREALVTRAPLIMENRKYAAYGPCGHSDLAKHHALPERPYGEEPAG
jgi:4-amino-4-deoxy-L-arabinose transferase-like glycosyltransferase